MNKGDTMKRKSKHLVWAGILPASLILLAGCGGAAGDGGDQAATAGFDFGAPQDEVDAVLADLEPVTLTFQPYSARMRRPCRLLKRLLWTPWKSVLMDR